MRSSTSFLSIPLIALLVLGALPAHGQDAIDVTTTDVIAAEDEVFEDEGITNDDLDTDLEAENLPTTNRFGFWWEGVRNRIATAFTLNAERKAAAHRARLHQLDRKAEACAEIGDEDCLAKVDELRAKFEENAQAFIARRQELRDKLLDRFADWREQRAERHDELEERVAERKEQKQELIELRKSNRREALKNRIEHRKEMRDKRRDAASDRLNDRREKFIEHDVSSCTNDPPACEDGSVPIVVGQSRSIPPSCIWECKPDTDRLERLRKAKEATDDTHLPDRPNRAYQEGNTGIAPPPPSAPGRIRLRHEQRTKASGSANIETDVRIEANTE